MTFSPGDVVLIPLSPFSGGPAKLPARTAACVISRSVSDPTCLGGQRPIAPTSTRLGRVDSTWRRGLPFEWSSSRVDHPAELPPRYRPDRIRGSDWTGGCRPARSTLDPPGRSFAPVRQRGRESLFRGKN